MPQTPLEMAKELVAELIRVHQLPPDETNALLMRTHAVLLSLHQAEDAGVSSQERPGSAATTDWKRSISRHAVICLECGSSFKQLSTRHLKVHGLDPTTYRQKYGIPSTQSLSSHQASARRRELAKQIRPWEQAAAKRTQNAMPSRRRRGTSR